MSTEADRRTQAASRIPFEALVEVGGATGPSFEAQAVNISEEGMQLRTAYLPDLGQPITCRFDAGAGQSVLASGEVVWAQGSGKGGEFGIRFTDMDPESIESLRRMCGVAPGAPPQPAGSKVRLHIEGLASPMRARVRDTQGGGVTVGSDLGFLQVGKELELEDAASGSKRPARIHRVEVEVDASSRVPQLVVSLRYADAAGEAAEAMAPDPEIRIEEDVPHAHGDLRDNAEGDLEAAKRVPADMKGALTRGVSKLGPAFSSLTKRAKTTIALLAAKRTSSTNEAPLRRTTAPAPGGGLHTSGRKVIRGESMNTSEEPTSTPKFKVTKRKVAIAGAVVLAIVLATIAFKKPSHTAPVAGASTADTAAAAGTSRAAPARQPDPPAALAATAAPPPAAPTMAPMAAAAMEPSGAMPDKADKKKGKPGKVTPFGNGPVAHGNVLKIKMDGPIEVIQGTQQPTGFTVHIPGRRSMEAAGPLASRDARIGAIKMSNDPNGAELTITFKDGVPNYQVRAKADTLEIALAQTGKGAVAKKDGAKHGAGAKKKHGGHAPDPH